jgi:hypothetical protein
VQGSSAPSLSDDDDEDVDEFLSSLGFEFVDARFNRPVENHDGDALSNGKSRIDCYFPGVSATVIKKDTRKATIPTRLGYRLGTENLTHNYCNAGVPGLPRVIDALSTIMWPSMVQTHGTRDRKSRTRDLLDWARQEGDDGLLDSDSSTADHTSSSITGVGANQKGRIQREIEELERWLEEDEVPRVSDQPWITVSSTDDVGSHLLIDPLGMTTSPMGLNSPYTTPWTGMELVSETTHQQSGFDDDFTVFVSAPAAAGPSGRSTPNTSLDSDMLDPMHTGASYTSLASVSDFGDRGAEEEEEDPDLPSEAEIQATSARIFGPTLSPTSYPANRTRPPTQSQSQPTATSSTSFTHPNELPEEETGYEVGNFDLSRVLNALQNMKEEISGMENEDERRKAAAKAALGLVYGLERQKDDDGGPL